jgi:hypothetical protein
MKRGLVIGFSQLRAREVAGRLAQSGTVPRPRAQPAGVSLTQIPDRTLSPIAGQKPCAPDAVLAFKDHFQRSFIWQIRRVSITRDRTPGMV